MECVSPLAEVFAIAFLNCWLQSQSRAGRRALEHGTACREWPRWLGQFVGPGRRNSATEADSTTDRNLVFGAPRVLSAARVRHGSNGSSSTTWSVSGGAKGFIHRSFTRRSAPSSERGQKHLFQLTGGRSEKREREQTVDSPRVLTRPSESGPAWRGRPPGPPGNNEAARGAA
jgi:hypothetical protein